MFIINLNLVSTLIIQRDLSIVEPECHSTLWKASGKSLLKYHLYPHCVGNPATQDVSAVMFGLKLEITIAIYSIGYEFFGCKGYRAKC